jgi:Ser/Thr protein kinase RdoA (MazF antagonist)
MIEPPGERIASGRAADVFALDSDRVLRRYRPGEGGDVMAEAAAMELARSHGFPVPAVYEASGRDLVLERVDGPSMLADLARRPWRLTPHARALAGLHGRLHRIRAPDGLRSPLGRGDRLVHFDLHPDNVLVSPRGPVVIDWSNASRGEPADDVALTWVILATSRIPGSRFFRALGRLGRDAFVKAFVTAVEEPQFQDRIPLVAQRRLELDPHLLESERAALDALTRARERD